MKQTISNITNESKMIQSFPSEIIGDIKKIFIHSNSPLQHVNLIFKTNENETIYSVKLENEIVVIYPYNFIDVQGRGVEYYSDGNLYVEIEGINPEDVIKQITVFFK